MPASIYDWRALPFREIWCVDFEYYPARGLANGGREGDAITPVCLVAFEMRSGRLVRLWQDELGRFPPYRLDADALIMGYMISAEFGCHIACGWGQPARALDPYVEFRHYVNDGAVKSGDRDKVFSDSPELCNTSAKIASMPPTSTICVNGFCGVRCSPLRSAQKFSITARTMFTPWRA